MAPQRVIEYVEDKPARNRIQLRLKEGKEGARMGPSFILDQALSETVTWYLENERWWRPLANERMLSSAPWKLKW
jgi:dTDP-glucose 4,6-dehydratase